MVFYTRDISLNNLKLQHYNLQLAYTKRKICNKEQGKERYFVCELKKIIFTKMVAILEGEYNVIFNKF